MIHADIEVEHEEDGRLQPVGKVERERRELERLRRVLRQQQHVLGVAVGGIGAGVDVALLRARRHAGRGSGTLHVHDHRGDFREIGKPDEFLHQRDARPRRRREGTRAVPAGTDDHADRGKLVLRLDDGEAVLPGRRIDAVARAMALERLGERRRRRDRIPGAHGGAAIDRAQRRRAVALDEDAVADRFGALEPDAERMVEIEGHVVAAEAQRVHVRLDQRLLGLELLGDQLFEHPDVHVEQRGERTEIDDVLEQLALARVDIFAIADRGERHADDVDVVAELRFRQRLGRIVEQVAAGLDRGDVLVPRLRVHRHHEVDAAARAEMTGLGDAHLVPGRQALDVGREDVARRDRHAHAQHRASEQLVRARRAGAVDVGEPDDEVVYARDGHFSPA